MYASAVFGARFALRLSDHRKRASGQYDLAALGRRPDHCRGREYGDYLLGDDYETPWWDYRNAIGTVRFDGAVTNIGAGTFHDCTSLTTVMIPAGVTTIGARAFSACEKLTSATIPEGVPAIDVYAFAG